MVCVYVGRDHTLHTTVLRQLVVAGGVIAVVSYMIESCFTGAPRSRARPPLDLSITITIPRLAATAVCDLASLNVMLNYYNGVRLNQRQLS